ncbi:MAG: tetratricopeptide repeat protein [Terriglobales bacterium]|jgi:tetratricopeptide (TPR) repeat protein
MKRLAVIMLILVASFAFADTDARQAIAGGNVDEVIRQLSSKTAATPNDAEAYHLLNRAYFVIEKWDQAIKAGEKAVALAPTSSDYHMWLGRAYGSKAEHSGWVGGMSNAKKSRAEFEKAVELNSMNAEARTDLAEFYMEAPGMLGGGKDKALAQAEAMAAYDAASAHWVKGRLAEKDGQYDVAESEYKQAIAVSKRPAGDWLNLASFYRHRGRGPELEDAIHHALEADKTNNHKKSNVLYGAAEILYRGGRDFNGAAQLLRRYLNGPDKTEDAPAFQAHYLLGEILEKQGNKPAAAEEYRAALSLAPTYEQAQNALKRVSQ